MGYLLLKHIWSNTGKHGVASARSTSALFCSPPALFAIKLFIGSTLHYTSNLLLNICVCCQTSSIKWVNQSGFTGNNTNESRESEFQKLRDAETSHRRAEGNCIKTKNCGFIASSYTLSCCHSTQGRDNYKNNFCQHVEYSDSQSKLI